MATGTAPPQPSAPPPGVVAGESDRIIDEHLDRTRRHIFWLDVGTGVVAWLAALAGFLFLAALWDHWIAPLSSVGRWLSLLTMAAMTGFAWWRWIVPPLVRKVNPAYAARVIEERGERLNNSLLNYLFLRRERTAVSEGVFQSVQRRAVGDLDRVAWDAVMDYTPTFRWAYVLAGLLAVLAAYKILSPKDPLRTVARVLAPWSELARPSRVELRDVQPGDVQTYHGKQLAVSADIRGLREGEAAVVVFSTADGQTLNERAPLNLAADGLRYEAIVPPGRDGVRQNLTYRIEAGDAVSRDFQVEVLPAPTIVVERTELEPPRYTQLPRATLEHQGDVRGVEGTKVTIHARASLPIKSAYLEFDPLAKADADAAAQRARILPMQVDADGLRARQTFVLQLKPDRSGPLHETYQVRFVTPDGVSSEVPIVHSLSVQADLAPEVEFLAPRQAEVTLRVDRRLPLEIRAIDPDFGLAKLTLRAERAGAMLLDQALVDDPAGAPGQVIAKYDVSPRKLQLAAGDELTLWAEVADNRADWKTGRPAPNTQRTSSIRLRIVAADAEREPDEASQPDPTRPDSPQPDPTSPEEKPAPSDDAGRSKPDASKPDAAKPDVSKPMTKPGSDEKPSSTPDRPDQQPSPKEKSSGGQEKSAAGEKPGAGEKPSDKPSDKPGQKPGDSASNQSGTKPGEKPGEKPDGKPNDAPGDQTGDMPSEKPGSKPGDAGAGKPGEKPSSKQESSGKPNDGSTGSSPQEKPGEKPNDQPGASPNEQPGQSQPPGKPGKKQPGNPQQSGGTPDGKGDKQDQGAGSGGASGGTSPKPNDPPAGADGSETGTPSGNSDGSNNSNGGQNSSNQPGRSTGKPGGNDPGGKPGDGDPTGELHDGDVIQRALEHLKTKQGNNGKPTGKPGSESPQPDGQSQTGKPDGTQTPKPAGTSPPKPGESDATATSKPDATPKPGEGSTTGKPGDTTPMPKPGSPAGQKPDGSGASQGAGATKDAGTGETGKPMGGTETKPETAPRGAPKPQEKSPGAGMGENGESGAGEKAEKPNGGSPSPLEKPQDRPKTQKPDDKSTGGGEPATPSESKKQSDSKGGEGGDRSGGGRQGGGQGAKQAGNDSAGSSSPGDDGNGAAKEQGRGPDGTQGGTGKPTEKPTGKPNGDQRGPGSSSAPGDVARPKPDGAKPTTPPAGKPDGANSPDGGQPGAPGGPNGTSSGPVTGGGKAGGAPGGTPTPAGEVPEGDEANLEYARKSTDLVLEYLKDQKESPDQELLDKLGWTQDDLRKFLDRWQQLKDAADRQDPAARRELDESLKSLGLRAGKPKSRAAQTGADQVRGNRDDGQRSSPPSKYAEQFKAFRKGTSRTEIQGK